MNKTICIGLGYIGFLTAAMLLLRMNRITRQKVK